MSWLLWYDHWEGTGFFFFSFGFVLDIHSTRKKIHQQVLITKDMATRKKRKYFYKTPSPSNLDTQKGHESNKSTLLLGTWVLHFPLKSWYTKWHESNRSSDSCWVLPFPLKSWYTKWHESNKSSDSCWVLPFLAKMSAQVCTRVSFTVYVLKDHPPLLG